MPITIPNYVKLIDDQLIVGLYQNLLRQTDVLSFWPFTNVAGLVARGLQWNTFPTPEFRKINASFTDTTGSTKEVEESLAIYGSRFKVDKMFDKVSTGMIKDPTQQQLDMHGMAIARGFVDNLINGDVESDPDSYDGLYRRFTRADFAFPARQLIELHASNAYEVLTDAASAQEFIKQLMIGMKYANLTGGNKSGAILMNENSWLGIQQAFKLAGYSTDQLDLLDQIWPGYMGVPFVDVGLKLDKSTEIILDTYDPGDSGNDATRIFIVRFGTPDGDVESPGSDGMTGTQMGPLETLGPEEYNTYWMYDLQWVHGLQHIGDDYCCVCIEHLKFTL